ncbi:hypothetical protein F5B22DRAFT_649086 [Xylaria bambusicola]|uniref:uncharacterized protein n=1 Tax=Xylaria bambusicola TaxID=326684 RepID=UPI00200783F3|nr:uncharacterized protein F5B22DRAFT_649086 [Xylaria bambusicola]KAI0509457.1 hypothetical protein F5B22DRAFT_649086 [Xylaria bambusicola]
MLDHRNLGGEEEGVETGVPAAQDHAQKKYKCPQCPSSFKRPENLKRHQRGHDETRRFMCQVCDKSFARSDILGRHVSTHMPLERSNDNPHRRRACHECARARERCSRGEPCRRCTVKSLSCLYPEEHQFKTMTPSSSSPSTSESGHYHGTTGVGWFRPQSPPPGSLYTPGYTLLQDVESPEWPIDSSPGPSRGPSAFSASPYKEAHPYQSDLPSPLTYDALSLGDERTAPWPTGNFGISDMRFVTGSPQPEAVGIYGQTTNMSLDLTSISSPMGFHQPALSPEPLDYFHNQPLDGGHFNADFYPQDVHDTSQAASLNYWTCLKSHEHHHVDFQAPEIDYDHREIYFQFGT